MLKTSKKSNRLVRVVFLAIVAMSLGIFLKLGLGIVGISASDDSVAQAQQNEMFAKQDAVVAPSVIEQPQYVPESQSLQARGLKFTASGFRFQNNHVFVDVCYDLPGNDIWDINMATLQYGDRSTSDFAVNEFFIEIAKDNKSKGSRCLNLDFYNIEPDSDVSTLKLIVGSLGRIPPLEGHECEGYQSRIKASSKISEFGIEVTCNQLQGGTQIVLSKRSESISDEEANALIIQAMYGQVDGPWEFTVTLNK
ncbi:MAG: hypothetical protein IT315_04750 [Anaerolineales bacterium]|nr:hypothetical protein [Anaerolineales bacterium]